MIADAERILSGWEDYCDHNWINDSGEDLYSPEIRVKRFLDSLGYYLLYGHTDGVITSYKEAVGEAREIPSSSCPSYVNNMIYGSGGTSEAIAEDEALAFKTMTAILDEKVPKRKKPAAPKPKQVSKRKKIQDISDMHHGLAIERFRVDRDGCFWVGLDQKQIVDAPQYRAKAVTKRNGDTDILFDMDRILKCGDDYYDMNGDPIAPECIINVGGIVDGYSDLG